MGWTIVGGLVFVGSQAWEWYHFIHGTAEGALETIVSFTHDGILYPAGTIIHEVSSLHGTIFCQNIYLADTVDCRLRQI